MSVSAGRARLKQAGKLLNARWLAARMLWRDAKSDEFEERYVTPLLTRLRAGQSVLEHMESVLDRLKRDCT